MNYIQNKKGNVFAAVIITIVLLFVTLLAYGKVMPILTPFLDTFKISGESGFNIFLMSAIPFLLLIFLIIGIVVINKWKKY